ncbi:hypothetical protein GQ55_1G405500 [Panicum hallii var. hallii]|uniref:Uncharacterized protein n=1 Tax=Panicum hallii var. hallii TaxID=1504633 RepID=A0A2T7FCQ0_9POAL|nr:hypothetical protein GQ55_1G405500 [Panicum hallii var. hallii]
MLGHWKTPCATRLVNWSSTAITPAVAAADPASFVCLGQSFSLGLLRFSF